MSTDREGLTAYLRPWLILGRISNLPTVWSNVLAAWLLAGGGSVGKLTAVLVGASCIYVAGMFLNDVVDADFDRRHGLARPIALGQVPLLAVLLATGFLLALAVILLGACGGLTFVLGLLLVLAVVVYDLVHKIVALGPAVMALCRYLVFLVGGSAGDEGIHGAVIWSGVALGCYVLGLSYVARHESAGGRHPLWPLAGLVVPLFLAALVNPPGAWLRMGVMLPALWFSIWLLVSLSHLARGLPGGPRRTVSGLLAGIVWVDVLAVMPPSWPWGLLFVGLFAGAIALQRTVPAT